MKEDLQSAKETKVRIPKESDIKSDEIFAVCLKTDDSKLLVPFKIYQIKLRGKHIRVIDEKGEVAIYPKEFFLPLQLPSETVNVLSTAYSHVS